MKTHAWLISIFICIAAFVPACSQPAKTVVSSAAASATDDYTDRGPGVPIYTKVTVQPTTQTATGAASTQPVHVTIAGTVIEAPPGASVNYDRSEGMQPAETSEHRFATATGSSLTTSADKGNFESKPQTVDMPTSRVSGPNGVGKPGGAGADAGGSSVGWEALMETVSSPAGVNAIAWFGAILIALGIAMIIFEHMVGGTADWALFGLIELSGCGALALSIVIGQHPWLFVLFITAVIGGLLWYVLYWKKKTPAAAAATTGATPAPSGLASFVDEAEAELKKIGSYVMPSPKAPATPAPSAG